MELSSVLLAAPIHKSKKYIFHKYIKNVLNIDYSGKLDKLFVDNSDDLNFYKEISDLYFRYADFRYLKECKGKTPQENQCNALNEIRSYFLTGNYDYLFLLESDLIPNKDILQHLIQHEKYAVAAPYFLDKKRGITSVTKKILIANNKTFPAVMQHHSYFDGELKEAENGVGFGCVLISRTILKKIKFRWGKNYADTNFWNDVQSYGFKVFVDTSQMIRHYPGKNGVDI